MKKLISFFVLDFFKKKTSDTLLHVSVLFLRVSSGLTIFLAHGLGKFQNFSKIAPKFVDPFGFLGSELSLGLVVFAEVVAAIALILGLFSRWSAFTLAFTLGVAAFVVHGPDPFKAKELAVMYFFIYTALIISGGGKYSLDYFIKKKFKI